MSDTIDMNLAEIGLCWGTISPATLIETIEAAARHGFPTITVDPVLYFDGIAAGEDPAGLRRRLRDAGVTVRVIDGVSTGMPGLPTEPMRIGERVMQRYDPATCVEVARELEAPEINVTHYRGDPIAFAALAEAVGAACRLAAPAGVGIALEFIPESAMPDIAAAQAIAAASGEPNCGILLDTWHFARSGGTPADIRALPPGAIRAFQLNDRNTPASGEPYVPMSGRLLPGEGELPLEAIIAAALANSPGITIEVEVFNAELTGLSPDAAAARTAAALKTWRDRLG